jgi:hypothetical protein
MVSIIDELMKQVTTGNNLSTIATSVGGDEKGVQSVLSMGLPLLMGSMANSASTPDGADTLTKMLTKTGANNPIDNLGSFLGNPEAAGGSGIVNTLFGNQTGAIQNAISQKAGLSSSVVSKILAIAAPMVMGHVHKMFTSQNLDQKGLSSLLEEQSKTVSSPEADSIAKQYLATKEKSTGFFGKLKKSLGS